MEQDGHASVRFTSVGRALLKSAPARVVRGDGYRIEGVAWGAPIERVEVRIDGGPWQAATLVDDGSRRRLRVAALAAGLGAAGGRGAHGHLAGVRHERAHAAGAGRPGDREQADLLGEQRPDHPPRAHRLARRTAPHCGAGQYPSIVVDSRRRYHVDNVGPARRLW